MNTNPKAKLFQKVKYTSLFFPIYIFSVTICSKKKIYIFFKN